MWKKKHSHSLRYNESEKDYIFFNIDFVKSYDILNLQSLMEASKHMSCEENFEQWSKEY